MGKARIAALLALLPALAMAGPSGRVAGCTKTAKACTCYDQNAKPVQVDRSLCEAAFAPSLMTVEGGDITPMLSKPKLKQVDYYEPLRKVPIPWLIER